MIVISPRNAKVGWMAGRVTEKNCLVAPAPSIVAAS